MSLKLPTYIAHPCPTTGKWAVSHYDGRGGCLGTSSLVPPDEAMRLARNGRERLRKEEKKRH
jgi:hypothetical protein